MGGNEIGDGSPGRSIEDALKASERARKSFEFLREESLRSAKSIRNANGASAATRAARR